MNHFLYSVWRTLAHAICRVAFWVGLGTTMALGLLLILFGVARTAIRPAPGAWATTVPVGPVAVEVGVASLIWLGTTPWVAQRLDGRTLSTAAGPVRMGWDAKTNTLSLHCQPCSLRNPSWGSEALGLEAVQLTVRRQGMQLRGTAVSGAVAATWSGQLSQTSLLLDLDLPTTPVREGYALFANAIPELGYAQIDGTFSLHATLSLPSQALTLQPHLEGLTVHGLGTAHWAQARSTCSQGLPPRAVNAAWDANSLLARAVVAAEDQRFYQHPGYDLVELTHALHSNQRATTALRGASTLSQQVAKLLVTGGERSPVRKLRELLYAVEMEQTLGKARILRLYLDNAPWGATVCGARAAAHTYFGKRVDRLTTSEAAWLAAMLHNPALEARRWASTGQINVARAQWVARGMQTTGTTTATCNQATRHCKAR